MSEIETPTGEQTGEHGETGAAPKQPLDLAMIERDLTAVEAALPRLDDGSYWLDESTGEPIPDGVLADDPVARRA